MSLHDADLKAKLTRFLNRKAPPRLLDGKPDAQADEITALLTVLRRVAPRDPSALPTWWAEFEPALSESCGRMWPTEKEIAIVGKQVSEGLRAVGKRIDSGENIDPAEQAARRMKAGEAVGEGWLYGIGACELIARGLIDRDTMTRYRSAAYHARVATYGAEAAARWEAEAKQRHEDAKALWAARNDEREARGARVPDKTSPAKGMAYA